MPHTDVQAVLTAELSGKPWWPEMPLVFLMPSMKQGKAYGDGVHREQFSDLKVFFVALALAPCQRLRFIRAANNLEMIGSWSATG